VKDFRTHQRPRPDVPELNSQTRLYSMHAFPFDRAEPVKWSSSAVCITRLVGRYFLIVFQSWLLGKRESARIFGRTMVQLDRRIESGYGHAVCHCWSEMLVQGKSNGHYFALGRFCAIEVFTFVFITLNGMVTIHVFGGLDNFSNLLTLHQHLAAKDPRA